MRRIARVVSCAAALGVGACGGGGGGGGSGGGSTCSPGQTASLTLQATGLSPPNVCVLPGGSVTFHNADTADHDVEFDTPGCPTVGDIAPGAQVTATFRTQQNCSFHDARNASSSAFQGTVAVTTATVGGGGY